MALTRSEQQFVLNNLAKVLSDSNPDFIIKFTLKPEGEETKDASNE